MRIDFTWPDHLIPMVAEIGTNQFVVDLFINSILLENDEDAPRRVTRMILDLMHEDQPLWRMEIPLPALVSHLSVDSEMDSLSEESRRNIVGEYLAGRIKKIHRTATFQPGSQGLMRRFPIRFLGVSAPDTLIVRVFSGPHLIGRKSISVIPFVNRLAFNFPLNGVWQAINNFDYTLGHRAYAGQEFAVDFVQVGPNGLVRKGKTDDPDDFFCFGADVEAIGDGEVVQIENKIEDNPADCNQSGSESTLRIKKHGYLAGRSGNHIIIKHDEDRYSLYAHLQKESIPVKPGDTVKKGQLIGRVGNSGQCSNAHLHFQLNEGPNPLGHRGLPMTFENLQDSNGLPLPLITHNNVIVHKVKQG
ncbi:M23 family metallopeptidase [bacterium]|nr:M23 family metallopeptidase [bacterium]